MPQPGMIKSCWYSQKQHGILVLCPFNPTAQLDFAGGVRPPGIWIKCLMLHIIGNKHRSAGMSIHVPIVNAWTLETEHSNRYSCSLLHLLYAASW